MSQGAGVNDGADMDEGTGMAPRDAAVIMEQARERAEHELTINRAAIFLAWALVFLIGNTAVWLSVRGQHPYQGPAGYVQAALALLTLLALGVTAVVTDRAASGVGGVSALRRRVYVLSIAIGLVGLAIMEAALRYNGVSRGVLGVVMASAPLLLAGVVLVAGTAAWLNWYIFGLGIWLIAVAAFGGFAGPVGVWAVDALAVGVPFLVMAIIAVVRGRR
jgi:hypothetical protein